MDHSTDQSRAFDGHPVQNLTMAIPPSKEGSTKGRETKFDGFHASSDTSLFSSSLPVMFQEKLNVTDEESDGQYVGTTASHLNQLHQGAVALEPFQDMKSQTIGNLPDDEEELLSGIMDDFDLSGLPTQVEDLEECDIFSSGGGMELDFDSQEGLNGNINRSILDNFAGNGNVTYGISNGLGTVPGEHPYGEHPSRTLFVRNINSNVEDSELRELFEQYGDIRTLYTACKHRGFVMISYYDIRSARSAMRALQNKPLRRRKLDIHFSIPKDNPSDKDVNQGTLVVFNLDPSVSNEDLRQIFGAYGEVKEIRETPHKRHHKFIEFYDVRAAEAALRCLNRSDIAGKRIKLEPSRPGGASAETSVCIYIYVYVYSNREKKQSIGLWFDPLPDDLPEAHGSCNSVLYFYELMEYYGTSSAMPRFLGSAVDPPPPDWNSQHVAADTGLEEAMWQMNLQSHDVAERGSFPERPGELDCAHYMRTGACGYGMSCRFNHPPRRNISAAVARNRGDYPERPGDPECQHFLKTGTCKFGATCKYDHPKKRAGTSDWLPLNALGYPLRLNEKECSHYVKTGQCKFGITCKFHHPQPVGGSVAIPGPSSYYPTGPSLSIPSPQPYAGGLTTWPISRTPLMANPYLPSPSAYVPLVISQGMMPVPGWSPFPAQVGSITSRDVGQQAPGTGLFYGPRYQTDGMNHSMQGPLPPYSSRSASMGLPSSNTQMEHMFPERHGQPECQFYMRTGYCKYGSTCKYHHPRDRTVPLTSCALSPLGLPLRSGAPTCSFYARQGFCKYGPTCKFDHPMGTLSYSPSSSSLADMPVAPYPVGSSPATLAPSFSSTELRAETAALPFKESIATSEAPLSSSASEALDSGARGPVVSTSAGLTFSESEENPLVKKSNQVSVLANGISKEVDIPISN